MIYISLMPQQQCNNTALIHYYIANLCHILAFRAKKL